MNALDNIDTPRLAALSLAANPDFRVLSRLKPRRIYESPAPGVELMRGCVVDTETTGTNPDHDKIIEIAMVPVLYTSEGDIVEVLEEEIYTGLQDPGEPLSDEVRDVTGLTEDDLADQIFDLDRINALAASCRVMIAHNASFDRQLLERLSPVFAQLYWLCTRELIDWRGEGVPNARQETIAASQGLFYDAHRALEDARALTHLLSLPLPHSGRMPLNVMRETLARPQYAIWLPQAPRSLKYELRRAGYRWSDAAPSECPRGAHCKFVTGEQEARVEWEKAQSMLRRNGQQVAPIVTSIHPQNRFSARVYTSASHEPVTLPPARVPSADPSPG